MNDCKLKYGVFIIAFLLWAGCLSSFSQETEHSIQSEDEKEEKIENISGQTDGDLDYSDLLLDLEYFQKHKINLNRTTPQELAVLFFLNEIQINNLLEHIRKTGKLISIYELQGIDGFDLETINKIRPYVVVLGDDQKLRTTFRDVFRYGSNDIFVRYTRILEEQAGFSSIDEGTLAASPNSRYLGSADKLYFRYRFKYYNDISWGITAEKDAGEEFFKGNNPNGFDFYSAHFLIRNLGIVKTVAIGDYNVQFGQGLTLWTGMGFGKSSDAVGVKKLAREIFPYTSADENNFMRGVATTLAFKNFSLTAFYSRKKADANISEYDTLNSELLYVSSIQEGGMHNTQSLIEDKDALLEQIFGGHLAYRNRRLNIGFTGYKTLFNTELQRSLQPYNQFEFSGKSNLNLGIDYSYIIRNFNIFGEAARSESGGLAFINGILINIDQYVSLSIIHRYYQRNYHSLYSNSFAEGGRSSNEDGIYAGLAIRFSKRWILNGYCDYFHFPWLKYRVDGPSRGQDYLAQLNYKPSKKMEMYFRYRYETKQINNTDEANVIDYPEQTIKQGYRFNLSWVASKSFTLKSRVELNRYKQGEQSAEIGYLIYQDVRFRSPKSPVSLSLRYAIFDTESWESRLYAYENDVLYSYSIPSMSGRGSRWYLLFQCNVYRNIDIWLRFAQTIYSDRNVIGSGLTEISGNRRSEIKAQIRLKF